MSATHQYPNLPQSTWSCWQGNLAPHLESNGCTDVQFSGGTSGTLAFHHSVPFSNGQFAFSYNYDPTGQTLTLTITDSPGIVPNSLIFSTIQDQIYSCPSA
ncbi:MAG TPA: hypothetical protein VHG28_23050 [Longimicrobiaceae bacterium]|nr:hypothetical protein [Longimicrobiaceae bacterium]